jgi:adenylate kinase family enzyme
MRRINVKGSSGAGKTTYGRAVAARLGLPYVEVDELNHGPNWSEATAEELQAKLRDFMAASPAGWVIDGNYERKLGDLVLGAADTAVWIDLPLHTTLARLWRRTRARIRGDETLWNDNKESWRSALWGRESLFMWAVRSFVRHRREWPRALASYPNLQVVRLRSEADVRRWLEQQ